MKLLIALLSTLFIYIAYHEGHKEGYREGIMVKDTCNMCGIRINNSGDKDLLMIINCWRDNYKRPVLMPFVYKLNEKIKE